MSADAVSILFFYFSIMFYWIWLREIDKRLDRLEKLKKQAPTR